MFNTHDVELRRSVSGNWRRTVRASPWTTSGWIQELGKQMQLLGHVCMLFMVLSWMACAAGRGSCE